MTVSRIIAFPTVWSVAFRLIESQMSILFNTLTIVSSVDLPHGSLLNLTDAGNNRGS